MSYRFQNVKHYKRGASWPDNGETRTCTTCRINNKAEDGHKRARAAKYTAHMIYVGTKWKLPVAYCEEHAPEGVKK